MKVLINRPAGFYLAWRERADRPATIGGRLIAHCQRFATQEDAERKIIELNSTDALHVVKSPALHVVKSPALHVVKSPALHVVKSPALHVVKSPEEADENT